MTGGESAPRPTCDRFYLLISGTVTRYANRLTHAFVKGIGAFHNVYNAFWKAAFSLRQPHDVRGSDYAFPVNACDRTVHLRMTNYSWGAWGTELLGDRWRADATYHHNILSSCRFMGDAETYERDALLFRMAAE